MNTQAAYAMIYSAVEQHPKRRLLSCTVEDQHFGSFLINFTQDGEERPVVNDRGFVCVTGGLEGTGKTLATVSSLYEADSHSLLTGLRL